MRANLPGTRLRLLLLAISLLVVLAWPARAGAVALQPLNNTFTAPIHVTSPPGDPRLFVVERGGTIKVYENGATLGTNFLDISARTTTDGERGLLSMAFDPNYATNGLFYVFYTGDGADANGALGDIHVDEFTVSADPNVADAASRREVLLLARGTGASNHNGGQLQFGKDGMLYISVGEAANMAQAQNLTTPHGKLLRIDPHGAAPDQYTIPSDNPFFGSLSARNEIWAYGLRNPFRFSIDHLDGSILIGDVGGGAREEIDYLTPSTNFGRGANLGWPCREGFTAGPSPGTCSGSEVFTEPIFDYLNPLADCAAIIGGYVYRGSDIPALAGRYLYTDLCEPTLRSLVPALPSAADPRSEGIASAGLPYSFGEDSRCELYIADGGGAVSKIVAFPGATPGQGGCATSAPGTAAGSPLTTTGTATAKKKKCKNKKTKRKRHRCKKKRKRKRGK